MERALWVLSAFLAAVFLPLVTFATWQIGHDDRLLTFCQEAKAGISLTDLLSLERRHGIDQAYLVQTRFEGYVDQAHSFDLEFRSQFMDPDFACAITHNGQVVKYVQLLTLEGFDVAQAHSFEWVKVVGGVLLVPLLPLFWVLRGRNTRFTIWFFGSVLVSWPLAVAAILFFDRLVPGYLLTTPWIVSLYLHRRTTRASTELGTM